MSWLKNRFDPNDISDVWAFDYFRCMWCGKPHANCFHHVKSPSSSDYVKGDFNSSILNACPLNNFDCHLYIPELHTLENEKTLLKKIIKKVLESGYVLKDKDKKFIEAYQGLYLDGN